MPKDWPINRDVVWTLTVNGKTEKAFGWLRIEWEIDPAGGAGGGGGSTSPERKQNQPPQVTIDPVSTAKVSDPAHARRDDCRRRPAEAAPGRRAARVAGRAGDAADAAGRRRSAGQRAGGGAGRPRRDTPAGATAGGGGARPVTRQQQRRSKAGTRNGRLAHGLVDSGGPADVTFGRAEFQGDKRIVNATFTKPGEYTLRAVANDTLESSAPQVREGGRPVDEDAEGAEDAEAQRRRGVTPFAPFLEIFR